MLTETRVLNKHGVFGNTRARALFFFVTTMGTQL